MEQKRCSTCKKMKDLDQFASKHGCKKQSKCRSCQKIISDQWYQNNKVKHKNNTKSNNIKYRNMFYDWKRTLKCSLCDESYYKCLDFHHVESDKKDITISRAVSTSSMNKVRKELEKCVVLCRNCHVKVHNKILSLFVDVKFANTFLN